jgi:hypothetical protein
VILFGIVVPLIGLSLVRKMNVNESAFWIYVSLLAISISIIMTTTLSMTRYTDENWETFNQGEHSFYINAVEGYFAPSSRSNNKTDWKNVSINKYFKGLKV